MACCSIGRPGPKATAARTCSTRHRAPWLIGTTRRSWLVERLSARQGAGTLLLWGGESPWARAVTILVLAQLGVGITNLLLHAPTLLQLAHLLVADLLWIATVLFLATALAAAPAGRPGEAMEATPAGSGAGG